jgi:heat shock protein HslJ
LTSVGTLSAGSIPYSLVTGGPTAYTISTGLTNTSGTLTSNAITGVAGGQTIVGTTNTTGSLTLEGGASLTGATSAGINFSVSGSNTGFIDRLGDWALGASPGGNYHMTISTAKGGLQTITSGNTRKSLEVSNTGTSVTATVLDVFAGNTSTSTSYNIFKAGYNGGSTNVFSIRGDGLTTINGNLTLGTAGNKVSIATGSNASVGAATLSSGTVTVSTTAVTASSLIYVVYNTPSGTLASGLSAPSGSIVAGTSFVINSLTTAGVVNTLDNSTVRYWIIN